MKALEPKSLFARRYEVVRCISTGGMGAVYEVVHLDTKRRRALKVMLPSLLVDDEMRRRFALEAVITANVASEHLIEVFDAGIEADTGCPFLAMELLDGQDLGKQLASTGPVAPSDAVELLRQAARALDRTHAAGIVHRDLKPENLFVARRDDGSPKIKILDFGIAKLLASQGGPTSRAMGTPLFMAPEQVDDTLASIGPAADLYALGQIAFALLAGTPYFGEDILRNDNVLALLLTVAKGTIEPASQRAARRGVSLPAGFDAWFAKATAREPGDRWKSAREMVDALALAVASDTATGLQPAGAMAVAAKSASTSMPRWSKTELLDEASSPGKAAAPIVPRAVSRPEGVETKDVRALAVEAVSRSVPPPSAAASNTTSLDPTVTSGVETNRRSRAPLFVALALPVALGLGYFVASREPATTAVVPTAVSQSADAVVAATARAPVPLVEPTASVPTVAPTASIEPTANVTASADAKLRAVAKTTTDKRPPVLPKASAPPPVVPAGPTGMPWEVRTPVKQP
jgi:eukaryotic-like serine/threonine-protein kinase